jgi:hypothetical protein
MKASEKLSLGRSKGQRKSLRKTTRWYEKKGHKSVDSALHQASKALTKSVKEIKGLLQAKYARKAKHTPNEASSKPGQASVDRNAERLAVLKTLNYTSVADSIMKEKLYPVARRECEQEQSQREQEDTNGVEDMIRSHPKINELLEALQKSIKAAVRDESIAKRDEALAEAKKQKAEEREKEGAGRKRSFDSVSAPYCFRMAMGR